MASVEANCFSNKREDCPMNIDERFEKLERDNKRLKRYVAVSISIALAALIGGTVLGVHAASGTFDNITAKNIFLKDNSGKTRVALYGNSGVLRLKDSSGKARVDAGSNGNLNLRDSSGKTRVWLDGNNGNLYLKDSSGKYRVVLKGKYGSVKIYKSNGQVKAVLGKGSGASGPHTHLVA
jgi:hypothetical protein